MDRGRTEASAPTDGLQEVCGAGDREGRPYGRVQEVPAAGRCGERTERCRWQIQRGERVAAVKISSVCRKAARKFWAPQQDHRPLRSAWQGVPAWIAGGQRRPPLRMVCKKSVGRATARVAPTDGYKKCLQDWAAGHMGPALQAQILYLFMCKTNQNTDHFRRNKT